MQNTTKLLLLALTITACNTNENTLQQVCLKNGTDYTINFWAYDGGHFKYVNDGYCSEYEPGAKYHWQADLPVKDGTTDIFARWEGDFEVAPGQNDFVFQENSGLKTYDFRDRMEGEYNGILTTLTLHGNDTLSITTDTMVCTLVKDAKPLQLNLLIPQEETNTLVFENDIYNFKFLKGSSFGQKDPFSGLYFGNITSFPGDVTEHRRYVGKKQ